MYELALFAGAGGGILGGKLLGWRTVCAVEFDAYARAVLAARQNDGCLDPFPIWDDVRTFTKRNNAVRPLIRALRRIRRSLVISGGFPCQDISCAGKGAGLAGEKSGLWREFARIIREIRPAFVFVENSPMLTSRGLGRVLGDLAAMGYHARWGVLGAVHAGAPHRRLRIWIRAELADSECSKRRALSGARHGLARKDGVPQREESAGRFGICREGVANSARDRRPLSNEQHDGWMPATQAGDRLRESGGVSANPEPQALPDPTGSGRETERAEAQQRGCDAGASRDVSGGSSRERERERERQSQHPARRTGRAL